MVSSEDGVRQGGCAAIVVTVALLEKPKRKSKKWVNDYLLERMMKGSYGGLLTELSLEKEIFKEYMRMIQSISVSEIQSDTLYSAFLYTSEILYTTEIHSISASCSLYDYSWLYDAMRARTAYSSIPSLPHQTTSNRDCSYCTEEAALHEEISEHARYVHLSAVLPLCATLSKLVACCEREMHCLLEPLDNTDVMEIGR